MPISSSPQFSPHRKWAKGSGCLVCGGNRSPIAVRDDYDQCYDLGVGDDVLGDFGLCFDCARAVAAKCGSVPREELETLRANFEEHIKEADRKLAEAKAYKATADEVFQLFGLESREPVEA